MPLRLLLGLVVCNLIWSFNPTMGKVVVSEIPPFFAAFWRVAGAFLAFLVAAHWIQRRGIYNLGPLIAKPLSRLQLMFFAGLGGITFFVSPWMQMRGLASTAATENAVIVALEPLVTIVMARIFLGEKLHFFDYVALVLALLGFVLLAEVNLFTDGSSGGESHFWGNLIILLSFIGEGSYSVLGRKLLASHRATGLFGSALGVGLLFFVVATPFVLLTGEGAPVPGASALLALGWLGPLSTAGPYLFWLIVLTEFAVVNIALTVFIQPIFGVVWGYLLLGERLSSLQILGACIIIGGVFLQVFLSNRRPA